MLRKILIYFSVLTLFYSCSINPVTHKREIVFISETQELEIGKNFYPSAIWDAEGGGGEFKLPELTSYLEKIVSKIHANSHRPHLPLKFAIQNSSIPNAWAIPGYVVITRGLLANLESEAEFAYIMGHEIGHISARHSAKQTTYSILANIGLVTSEIFLAGKEYSAIALEAYKLGGTLLLLKYSRDDELEADRLGIEYMTHIGYKPENAINAHINLEKSVSKYLETIGKNSKERSFLEELLSTHPRNSIRIEELKKLTLDYPVKNIYGDGTNRETFLKNIEKLQKINLAYIKHYDKAYRLFIENELNEAEKELNMALGIDQTQPAFYTLKGMIYIKKGLYDIASQYIQIALDLDKDYQPAIKAKGFISYKEKKYIDSARQFEKAIYIYPNDIVSFYYAGLSYFQLSNYRKAINYFKRIADLIPMHQEVHGYLGICYENIGDLNSAYREYSLQVKINPNNELGIKALERIKFLQRFK